MIEIKNLTKIYDKSKEPVKALNNISLVLPDKGFVFVLGKSGSGKSTFLNMLGGLDNVTKGDILLNGMSIVDVKNSNLDKYRNDYVGIIYQNFNLFPNETVRDNILTSAIISSKKIDDDRVSELCEELDLSDKENVLVKNLSGGQKQRVAIARALIKDPELILADEPTGNLDSKTTKVIFNTLKKISKEKLIVVISHDTISAEKYADRIIYLSDGKVVDDVVKNPECKEVLPNSMELPTDREYTEDEVKSINKSLKKHNLQAVKKVEKFIRTNEEIVSTKESPSFKKSKGTFNLALNVSNRFLKSTIGSFAITLIILTFIIGILSLSQTFAQFDGKGAVAEIAKECDSKAFIINKAYSYYDDVDNLNKEYLIRINDEDIEKFKDAGYKGNIYKVYNTSVAMGFPNLNNESGRTSTNSELYSGIYSYTGLGTVVCDYDYLEYLYGDLKVLAGSLYDLENNSKLIVTDYFADSLLYVDKKINFNQFISEDLNDPYQKITNEFIYSRYKIGAIIETGYKERYKGLFESFKRLEDEPQNAHEIREEIANSLIFLQFYDELNSSLNFTYSVNKNFYEDYIEEMSSMLPVWVKNCTISYNNNKDTVNYNLNAHFYAGRDLPENTAVLNVNLYNKLFDKSVTVNDITEFEEKEIVLSNYDIDQDTREPARHKLTLKVVGVASLDSSCLGYFDLTSYKLLASDAIFPYSLVFDNVQDAFVINDTAKENFFYTTLNSFVSIFEICNIIDIFSSIFIFIVIALIFIELIIVISHNLRTIRKNQYRIGVYRGLGCPSKVFSWACLFNTITLVASTFITSFVFVLISSKFINNILVKNFEDFTNSKVVSNFTFVDFTLGNLSLYMLLVLVVGGVSMFAPILKLRNLKPNLILNKAE